MPKRIAIIGAGVSGIIAAKCCLEQSGLEIVVFDKTDYIGGLWHYNESLDEDGIASVMKTTVINTSKEMMAFSDFPPPGEFPNYMPHTLNIKYYCAYAERFNFRQYVRFRHVITSVEMSPDHTVTGRWIVRFQNLDTKTMGSEVFDGVMICVGHHNVRNEPKFKGQEHFQGRVMHTHSLKSGKGLEDQRVVVVGLGNSGVDAAVEASSVASQVYLSTRRGGWIFPKIGAGGLPTDAQYTRRAFLFLTQHLLPHWLFCSLIESDLNKRFDHALYGLKPAHRALGAHITSSDVLPSKIIQGTVKVKGDIERFTEKGVVFKGEEETPVDVVILATGYKAVIPFLSDSILPMAHNRVRLYKQMLIPRLEHPETLGIIGQFQATGAAIPIYELQCRYFALLNTGKIRLPPRHVMEADIDRKLAIQSGRYYASERHTFQEDYLTFLDELAELIGCSPPIWRYALTDPVLWYALVFGPAAPYQFRLVGPNAWPGAREAMLSVNERVEAAFGTGTGTKK